MPCHVMVYDHKSATARLTRELALLEADVSLRLRAASSRVQANKNGAMHEDALRRLASSARRCNHAPRGRASQSVAILRALRITGISTFLPSTATAAPLLASTADSTRRAHARSASLHA